MPTIDIGAYDNACTVNAMMKVTNMGRRNPRSGALGNDQFRPPG